MTYTPISAIDILTGPMSGCWISIFESNGKRYAAHIGTSIYKELTNKAKASWRTAVNSKQIKPLHSCDPLPLTPLESKSEYETFFCIITAHGQIYSVAMAYASNYDASKRRITRIIKNDNKFMDVMGF